MSRLRAAHTRPKPFHVHTVGIDDDLFRVYPTHFEVAALDFRDDKSTRRRVKVQSLVSLQQLEPPDASPMLAPPASGAVVFEQQRPLRAQRSHHSRPTKTRVSLINEIGIGALDARHRAARENKVVVNINKRPRPARRLRRNDLEALVRKTQPCDQIVAEDPHFNTERLESLDHALDVTGSAAGLRAWSRRRAQVNHA